MMRKIFLLLTLLISPLSSLQAAETAEKNTLIWGASSDALSLDPYSINEVFTIGVLENTYEGLVRRNEKLELEHALATSWKQTSPLVWRFNLRQGVKFHDGSAFTADDVIFSFNRAMDKFSDLKNYLSTVETVKKIDDYTVEFMTKTPSIILPQTLSVLYIMSKTWCEKNKSENVANYKGKDENFANRNTNGTGPFKIVKRTVDVSTTFEAFDGWWDTKAHNLDEVILKPIKSDSTRVSAILGGEVDVMFPVPIQDEKRILADNNLEIIKGPELRTIMFQMNQETDELRTSTTLKGKNPFKDKRVREAMYKAIDIDGLHEKVMRGNSYPTGLIFGDQITGFDPVLNKRYAYNVNEAKALMKAAGYEDGFDVTLDCPNDRYVSDEAICIATSSMLAKIGIRVNPRIQSKAKFFPTLLNREGDFYIFGWIPLNYDGSNPLKQVLATKSESLGHFNFGRYSNTKLDELIKQIDEEQDAEKRKGLIGNALTIAKEDFAVLPLHQQMLIWAHKKNVNIKQRADEILSFRMIKKQ